MKKKIFVLLMSLAMVVTMMPLSVFAETQNEQVRTDLGNTGLYLLGDRAAVEGEAGDYIVRGTDDIQILTNGWTLGGQSAEAVIQPRMRASDTFEITFEDGLIIAGLMSNCLNTNIKIDGNVVIDSMFWTLAANLTGTGTLAVKDGSLYIAPGGNGFGCPFTLDGPTVVVNNLTGGQFGQLGVAATFGDNLIIKSGKFIANNYTEQEGESYGILCIGDIQVSQNGELFVSALDDSVLWQGSFSSETSNLKGSAETVPYEERESVTSDVTQTTVEIPYGTFNAFAIDGTNETLAKTVYCSNGVEPTTSHKVIFMDGDTVYTTQEVEDGYCAKMPVDPVEDGYKFTGWYYDKETKDAYDFNTPVTADLTLYAGWQKEEPTPTPTPNPPVNPTNTGNGAQGGVSTGDSAMPIIYITLGFAAAVVGFYGFRRLRDR